MITRATFAVLLLASASVVQVHADNAVVSREALTNLALSGDPKSLGYLHELFETYPERRPQVAVAVAQFAKSKRRRPQDWRLLVRSLTVVEGDDARQVMQALIRFHERATKPRWIRRVILLGLTLRDNGASDAVVLLRHWTNTTVAARGDSWRVELKKWQCWFKRTYPQQPDPIPPVDVPGAKWKYKDLGELIYSERTIRGHLARGELAFQKAQCHKCHRVRGTGSAIGPDLSSIADRMQKKEILEAILFPSEYVSDQFTSYTFLMKDGRILRGIPGPAGNDAIVVLQADGKQIKLLKRQIDESYPSKYSTMPEGSIQDLTKQQIADLFYYLTRRRE